MLNSSSENGHPCLVSDLKGNVFNLEYDNKCELLKYGLCYVEVCFFYMQFVKSFVFNLPSMYIEFCQILYLNVLK